MSIENNLKSLKVIVPDLTKPIGYYSPATRTGNMIYTSGQLAIADGRIQHPGRVGKEVTLENAQRAAKLAVINALACVKWILSDLEKIKKIVRLNGYVCSALGFNDQPKVINGASELLLQIFGDEIGAHSRTSIGVLELPLNSCVEIDLIVEQ